MKIPEHWLIGRLCPYYRSFYSHVKFYFYFIRCMSIWHKNELCLQKCWRMQAQGNQEGPIFSDPTGKGGRLAVLYLFLRICDILIISFIFLCLNIIYMDPRNQFTMTCTIDPFSVKKKKKEKLTKLTYHPLWLASLFFCYFSVTFLFRLVHI